MKNLLIGPAILVSCLLCLLPFAGKSSDATITIHADAPGAKINPAMWGIFFEDINFGADGGLYAELVKNRGFEFPDALMGWNINRVQLAKGEVAVRADAPFNGNNPHYVRIQSDGTGLYGLSNEGFRGMGVKAGEAYDFSVQIRGVAGQPVLKVELFGGDGTLLDKWFGTFRDGTSTGAGTKLSEEHKYNNGSNNNKS